jgi:uncharacterized protein YdeI (YjbR/CyaY-like superfamily)
VEIRESLTVDCPEDLRRWFEQHAAERLEIWLNFRRKSSGKQTLTIAQAVEEALCFGWIQSRLKPLGPDGFSVRFSPRRAGSYWSLPNLARVRRITAEGRMTEAGLAVLPESFRSTE